MMTIRRDADRGAANFGWLDSKHSFSFGNYHDPEQLGRAFRLTFGVVATFSLATGVGASLVAEDLVLALLGERWHMAVPFVQLLALNSAFWAITQGMMPFLLVTRRERMVAQRDDQRMERLAIDVPLPIDHVGGDVLATDEPWHGVSLGGPAGSPAAAREGGAPPAPVERQ